MTNAKSGKVVSPGIALNLGGTFLKDQVAPSLEARLGLVPRLDVGVKIEPLCYVMDTRLQLLGEERNSIDVAAELGVGIGIVVRPFVYGGLAVSKDLGTWNPYCLFRLVDMRGIDSSELEGLEAIIGALLFYVPAELDAFWEIFLGVEIELGHNISILPELMLAPQLNAGGKPLAIFNLGLMFKLH